jgi:hypothetical protein
VTVTVTVTVKEDLTKTPFNRAIHAVGEASACRGYTAVGNNVVESLDFSKFLVVAQANILVTVSNMFPCSEMHCY